MRRFVPAPFAALSIGTFMGMLWLRDAPVIGDIPFGLPTFRPPVFSFELALGVLEPAFLMALLCAAGTLVTALQADAVTDTQHKPNRDLVAHGIGNIAAGLVGGSPGPVSSAVFTNLASGGRYPVSAITAAGVLLLLSTVLKDIAAMVPLAASSGILIRNGWDIRPASGLI